MPFLDADPTLSGRNLAKDLLKVLNMMRGQANGEAFRIQDPAYDQLDGTPRAVPFQKLLDGDRLLPCG